VEEERVRKVRGRGACTCAACGCWRRGLTCAARRARRRLEWVNLLAASNNESYHPALRRCACPRPQSLALARPPSRPPARQPKQCPPAPPPDCAHTRWLQLAAVPSWRTSGCSWRARRALVVPACARARGCGGLRCCARMTRSAQALRTARLLPSAATTAPTPSRCCDSVHQRLWSPLPLACALCPWARR
jgi:hypothetical protein